MVLAPSMSPASRQRGRGLNVLVPEILGGAIARFKRAEQSGIEPLHHIAPLTVALGLIVGTLLVQCRRRISCADAAVNPGGDHGAENHSGSETELKQARDSRIDPVRSAQASLALPGRNSSLELAAVGKAVTAPSSGRG
jgi:hypothetical protein